MVSPPKGYCKHLQEHITQLAQYTEDLWKKNSITDTEIIVGNKTFRAHRAVITCFSPFLNKRLIRLDGSPGANKIVIENIVPEAFETLLHYMYTGELKLSCQSFLNIYNAAKKLEMTHVKNECHQRLKNSDLKVENYFYLYVSSKEIGQEESSIKAYQLILNHFEEAICTSEFLELTISQVCEVLSGDQIGARSEVLVYLAALKWLNFDYQTRHQYSVAVMECIRFSVMTPQEILACFYPPVLPSIVDIPEVTTMMLKATCYITAKQYKQEANFQKYAGQSRKLLLAGEPLELWNIKNLKDKQDRLDLSDEIFASERERNMNSPKFQRSDTESKMQPKSKISLTTTISFDDKSQSGDACQKCGEKNCRVKSHLKTETFTTKFALPSPESSRPAEKLTENSFPPTLISEPKTERFEEQRQDGSSGILKTVPSKAADNFLSPGTLQEYHSMKFMSEEKNSMPSDRYKPQKIVHEIYAKDHNEEYDAKSIISGVSSEPCFLGNIVVDFNVKNTQQKENFIHNSAADDVSTISDLSAAPCTNYIEDISSSANNNFSSAFILVLGGINLGRLHNADIGNAVLRYEVSQNVWSRLTSIPEPRHHHGSVYLDGHVYVIGGCDSRITVREKMTATNSCFKYNIKSGTWFPLGNMKYHRCYHGVVATRGRIFAIGGHDERNWMLSSVESYDPITNKWMDIKADMCCGKMGMGIAVHSTLIYTAGGLIQGKNELNVRAISYVDCLDPIMKKWMFRVSKLPSPRCFATLAEWSGRLYVLGGAGSVKKSKHHHQSSINEVRVYDDEKRIWRKVAPLRTSRHCIAAVPIGSRLYVLGGSSAKHDKALKDVEYIEAKGVRWVACKSLPTELTGLAAVGFDQNP